MAGNFDVVALVGSLRKESFSKRLARGLISVAPASLKIEIVSIGEMPFYNQDLEVDPPPAPWQTFRDRVRGAHGVLFVTPEYNRGLPAVLKNAIDVGSRPYGKSVWSGKPAAVISNSPGAIGGFGANHALRQSLPFLNMPELQIEAYLGASDKLFDASENFVDANTRTFCTNFMNSFESLIQHLRR